MHSLLAFVSLSLLAGKVLCTPTKVDSAKRATCTVNSVASSEDLSDCSSVVIEAFSVPNGETVTISAAKGATVTMTGSMSFSSTTASGPLITIDTDDVSFNGNGFSFKGNGDLYWDGEGTNGGVAKPHPFLKLKGYGTFTNFIVKDSPAQAVSIGVSGGSTVISDVLVDNLDGDTDDLGHNTDGFDLSASDVTITGCTVYNQDDCLAINSGSNIVFENNYCSGGHGISIGSIASDKTVSGVTISGNTVVDSMYGLRIKVDSDASDASVSDVTYSGNTLSGIDKYGVLISQSYPDDFSTPGSSSTISDINFTGSKTTVSVDSSATMLAVDCGNCEGTWNFSELDITGGKASVIDADDATIEGGTY